MLGDFGDGDIDNPMSAFSSLPHVPGHEVVAEVVELGPEAQGLEVGDRVVLNPWLTCAPRGVEPLCPPCRAGDLNLCWSFTRGALGPGVHVGVTTDAPGAWADLLAAHDSMLIPVPDAVPDTLAVLADPFAVSMHAIVRHPPPPGGKVLVYGAGALGATSVAALRALYPDVEVAVVARFPAQAEFATRLWAQPRCWPTNPASQLVEELAAWSGGVLHTPFDGLPVAHPGGIDVVYDTIARPETLEVGRARARRARHPRPERCRTPRGDGSGRRSTSRSSPSRARTPSGSRRSTACASTPSPTTSTWRPRGASTSPACSPTVSRSSSGGTP